jgi:tricorn protease
VTSSGYLSFPHVHDDVIAFVAAEGVWLASSAGGRAWRLSADRARASRPRFSRDGSQVAWTGSHHGGAEVYLAATDGGLSRRLTYWGDGQTEVCGWTPGGEVLAVSAAGQPFSHLTWAHAISVGSGAQTASDTRLPCGPVGDLAVEPAAVVLLTATTGRDPAHWKRYRGGTAGRLWVGAAIGAPAAGAGFRRVLADVAGQFASPMLVGGRLAFLSDHEGTGNLYSCALDGTDLRRHTDHDGSYARQASTDGERIIYACAGSLWLLDGLDATQPRPLDISLGAVAEGRAPRLLSADDHLGSLSCDATGRASAVEVRGTVHWLSHRDGPALALSVTPGARARLPQVLGKDGQVAWVTDADGLDALEIGTSDVGAGDVSGSNAGAGDNGAGDNGAGHNSAGDIGAGDIGAGDNGAGDNGAGDIGAGDNGAGDNGAGDNSAALPRRIAAGSIGQVASLAAAPDGARIAVAALDGHLRVVDVASGDLTELAASDNGEVTGLAWSTDSEWLAWSQPATHPLSRLRIARVADGQVTDVTDGRFADTEPVFTIDGKYLAFLSKRSFDPVYDAHFFDLSFPFGARPYLIPLSAAMPSPFGPQAGGRIVGDEPDDEADDETGKIGKNADGTEPGGAGVGDAKSGRPPAVVIDTEGMADRIVVLPVPESRYSSLRAVKGGLAWLCDPVSGSLGEGGARLDDASPRSALQRFDLKRHDVTELDDEVDWFEVSGDGTRLVIGDHDSLAVVQGDRKVDLDSPDDRISVDATRARFVADPGELWAHAFDEAGRLIRHDFWVADMADVDWDGVLAQYRPLVERIASAADFVDVLRETVGELGTSHAYVGEAAGDGDGTAGAAYAVGLLGADLERGSDGSWLISRVVPGESSDPRARSPLSAPGVQVRSGDRLLAVDGRPVTADGPGPLLAGSAGKPVELTLSAAGGGGPRRVVVVPLASERRLRYQDWVSTRRALVRELSGGRVGYLHVPDMVSEGWADFHRDLRAEMVLDALIIDARGNRGGHTSQLVVEKLARRVIAWDVPRGLQPQSYPLDAPRGPVVAISDEYAGSDGDIVTRAIRTLELGPVVGARTWGGVIGIEGWHELVDGTRMTVPKYAFWMEGVGWGVENYGVDPDIEVLISPDDWAAGRDTQLETGVRLATEALRDHPAATPPGIADRPSRRRPPLPPRPSQ